MPDASTSPGEILLVRHGRSAHVARGWMSVDDVRRWMTAYDAAPIAPHDAPPPALVQLGATADVVVASDLPRAVTSAARLASPERVTVSPLLREAPLECAHEPLPRLGGARMPFHAWGLVHGARWLGASWRGAPPPGVDAPVLARADECAEWLVSLAAPGTRVLAVTHATFRSVVSAALVRRRWRQPERRGLRHWSAWHHMNHGGG
jgi:hypothetical protein